MALQDQNNTNALQKRFPNIYRDFFSKCEIIFSAPVQFGWSGGIGMFHGAISLIQKLPLRVYVGLKKTKKATHIASFQAYIPFKDIFGNQDIHTEIHEDFFARLERFLKVEFGTIPGFEIHILAESDWMDINPVSVGLGLGFLTYFEQIDKDFLAKIQETTTKDLLIDPKFDRVLRFIWKIAFLLAKDGHIGTSGGALISALLDSDFPILYMLEKRIGDDTNTVSRFPHVLSERTLESIEKYSYWSMRFEEVDRFVKTHSSPMDFAILYPGVRREHHMQATLPRLMKGAGTVEKTLLQQYKSMNAESFGDEEHSSMKRMEYIMGILHTYSSRVIESYASMYEDFNIQAFIKHLSQFHNLNSLFCFDRQEENILPVAALRDIMKKYVSYAPNELFVQERMISGDLKVLAVMKAGYMHTCYDTVIAELQKDVHEHISLEYASWRDGIGKMGVRMEQNLSKSIKPVWLGDKRFLLKENGQENIFLTEKDIENIQKDFDILVFMDEAKISIGSEKVNCDEVRSQSFTSLLLNALIEAKQKKILSTSLPSSSYAINRNDMEQKITRPLTKIVQDRLGKNLGIHVEGDQREFEIFLETNDVRVGVVERI